MKTISEFRAEQRKAALREQESRVAARFRVDCWMLGIKERNITPIDATNRFQVRLRIESLEAQAVDLACDNCGTRLFNPQPDTWLPSAPMRARLGCPGCGATEYLTGSEYESVVNSDWLREEGKRAPVKSADEASCPSCGRVYEPSSLRRCPYCKDSTERRSNYKQWRHEYMSHDWKRIGTALFCRRCGIREPGIGKVCERVWDTETGSRKP